MHAGGQRFESVILHSKIFDILKETQKNEQKDKTHIMSTHTTWSSKKKTAKKVTKGVWGMPWLSEAKKDVISCDKLRGGANNLRSVDFRMGEPISNDMVVDQANPGN